MNPKGGGWKTDRESVNRRFWSKVDIKGPDDCWNWKRGLYTDGYGQFCSYRAHRFSMMLYLGRTIRKEELVCHSCDNRRCVNPKHLFLSTPLGNMQDRDRKGRYVAHYGKDNASSKLTYDDVRKIRRMLSSGEVQRKIARVFGVCAQTICNIKYGRIWRHVK